MTTSELLQQYRLGMRVDAVRSRSRLARKWLSAKKRASFLRHVAAVPQFKPGSLAFIVRMYLRRRRTPASSIAIAKYVSSYRGFRTRELDRTITRVLAQLANHGYVHAVGQTFLWRGGKR